MSSFSRAPFRCRGCQRRFYRYYGELKRKNNQLAEAGNARN